MNGNAFNAVDTIAAPVTGFSGDPVGVIRISGPKVGVVKSKMGVSDLKPNIAKLINFNAHDGSLIDQGLVLFFKGPNSFTGEDVLEFQGHGNAILLEQILETLSHWGIRLAEPGEFSKRAYLNGKMDLTQAESICDLIVAGSRQVARLALCGLQGDFSKQVYGLTEDLMHWRIATEAAIDFPEEDEVPDVRLDQHRAFYKSLEMRLAQVFMDAKRGSELRKTQQIAFVGPPNVGKSTWFNLLLAEDRAIVSDRPGTTRDVVTESCQLGGATFTLADTAGVHATDDQVEMMGIERTLQVQAQSDFLILMLDASIHDMSDVERFLSPESIAEKRHIVVMNKSDLVEKDSGWDKEVLWLSRDDGASLKYLEKAIAEREESHQTGASVFLARRRHLDSLEMAGKHLSGIEAMLNQNAVDETLIAEELRLIQTHLSRITGEVSTDALLDEIFSKFCMGK